MIGKFEESRTSVVPDVPWAGSVAAIGSAGWQGCSGGVMRLETRFAGIIASCFVFGICTAGYISYRLEARQAREEVKQKADMVLETAMAVRAYTSEEVAVALQAMDDKGSFHAAQVPSFAAQSAMRRLAQKLPEYQYRESSLNPTNLNDRATDWEVGLLRAFQADPQRTELSGELGAGQDRQYYVARPIRMGSPACLYCHSTPEAAPRAMVARYGAGNGFGWRMGDVVGLHLVRVSTAPAEAKAFNSVVVMRLLRRHVTSPLEALTRVALATSLDKPLDRSHEDPPLPTGHGQFEELQRAIQRLKASMDHALRLIERRPLASPGSAATSTPTSTPTSASSPATPGDTPPVSGTDPRS